MFYAIMFSWLLLLDYCELPSCVLHALLTNDVTILCHFLIFKVKEMGDVERRKGGKEGERKI